MTRPVGQFPAYPSYTGREPCTADPYAFYATEEDTGKPHMAKARTQTAKEMCSWCPIIHDCLMWALHRERYGTWGGTTEDERRALRRKYGIRLKSPESQWDLESVIIRARPQRADLLETGT